MWPDSMWSMSISMLFRAGRLIAFSAPAKSGSKCLAFLSRLGSTSARLSVNSHAQRESKNPAPSKSGHPRVFTKPGAIQGSRRAFAVQNSSVLPSKTRFDVRRHQPNELIARLASGVPPWHLPFRPRSAVRCLDPVWYRPQPPVHTGLPLLRRQPL